MIVNWNGYRFGFNGQEKDNEIAGIGNSNTAKFWQYDTRLGRRWNLDPVDQVAISNYAVMANNPILLNDPLGDTYKSDADKEKAKNLARRAQNEKGTLSRSLTKLNKKRLN